MNTGKPTAPRRGDERDRIAAVYHGRARRARKPAQSVTHYIAPGGAYAAAYAKLKGLRLPTSLGISYRTANKGGARAKKASSKTKFTCPECGQNAWAKSDAVLICGECYEDREGDARLMLAEETGEAAA